MDCSGRCPDLAAKILGAAVGVAIVGTVVVSGALAVGSIAYIALAAIKYFVFSIAMPPLALTVKVCIISTFSFLTSIALARIIHKKN